MADRERVLFGVNINVELEQTLMRLVLVFSGTAYGLAINYRGVFEDGYLGPAVVLGYFYVMFSLVSMVHVYLRPAGRRWRHTVYMCTDILVTSIVMHYFGKYGVPFFVAYLWLTVGNGFRYGYIELIRCAGLSLIGFITMCVYTPYWREEYLLAIACVMLLSVIPLYVAIMLKRLQEEKDKAERANREKTRFLSNVSHEIRTPLNAVMGFSEMLDKNKDAARQAQLTRHIRGASRSLMSLVEGVLDFSRIESGHVRIENNAFNLYELVHSIEGMFSLQTGQAGVRYVTDLDVALPPVLNGDVDRLRQILVNLVGNAVKFTSTGEIRLRVSRDMAGDRLLFEVIDTGIGISGAMQAQIFDRFRQADDTVQRRYGGTGLGTSIAKRLVDLMDGQIGVDSEEARGSRFWFHIPLVEEPGTPAERGESRQPLPDCYAIGARLPQGLAAAGLASTPVFSDWQTLQAAGVVARSGCVLVDCATVAEPEPGEALRQGLTAGSCLVAICADRHRRDELLQAGFHLVITDDANFEHVLAYAAVLLVTQTGRQLEEDLARYKKNGKRLQVLVADDCRLNRHVMSAMLNDMGIESDFASSGPMALEKLRSDKHDLLILDIQMPGMSGFDVIELYRARNTPDRVIPIIVVTGDATAEIHDKCEQLGVSRFLLKPVGHEKLRGALASLVLPGEQQPVPEPA